MAPRPERNPPRWRRWRLRGSDSPSYYRIKPFRKARILLDEILGSTLEHADVG